MTSKNINIHLLEYLFLQNFFSDEEARQLLIEEGEDIEKIDNKVNEFLKKLEAKKLILEGKLKKLEFEKNVEEFKQISKNLSSLDEHNYSLAARKGNDTLENTEDDELFLFIKKKNMQKDG
ncbi:MAG: hypothetical protein N2249_01925 [Melioribacter sp.]|nr:hypothetical protein [Melioribacter sp.]